MIDFRRDGKPIGIEILAPEKLTLAIFNRVLRDLGLPTLKRVDLAPLKSAMPTANLNSLLAKVTKKNVHREVDIGPAIGGEVQ